MFFFSKKSKAKRAKEAEQKEIAAAAASQPRRNVLTKAQSTPGSRSNSMRGDSRFSMVSHPAYAQANIINPSSTSAYLPVPQIPAELQKDRSSADKAAKILGVDKRAIQSAPVSPKLQPRRFGSNDNPSSRHDSVNSNVDTPRIGRLQTEKSTMSLSEELALDPVFSESSSDNSNSGSNNFRRSMSIASRAHERNVSHDSFRPTSNRRHTMHHAVASQIMQRRESFGRSEQLQRGRSQQLVPSYSMPTNASRASMQADSESLSDTIVPPLPGAHQPRSRAYSGAQDMPSSPFIRPQHLNYDDAASIRSCTPSAPLVRHASRRSTVQINLPPLSILDGLKVNKRGRILDEEGEVIGELVEGDIIDCVRQKANAFGEVIDEYGRVVGKVQTLLGALGVSSPAMNLSSPALLDNRNVDYFNLLSQSPMLTPSDGYATHRRVPNDEYQKYRMMMEIPPVPSMPAVYQSAQHSPALTAQRCYTAPFESFDGTHCAELSADVDTESVDDVPVFDLSEPFMPTPSPETEAPMENKIPASLPVEEKTTSPEVPVKSRQRGLSLTKEQPAQPKTAPPPPPVEEPQHHVAPSIASTIDDDEFEEAETHFEEPQRVEPVREVIQQPAQPSHVVPAVPIVPVARPAPKAPVAEAPRAAPKVESTPAPAPVPVSTLSSPPDVESTTPPTPTAPSSTEQEAVETVARPVKVTSVPAQQLKPILTSRAKTAPVSTVSQPMAPPPLPRATTLPETQPLSTPTSGYNSAEDSLSEGESVEVQAVQQRKGVRISNLPPTTIPSRGLTRSLSDGGALSRVNAMPSVPETEPLPDGPRRNFLSPADASPRSPRGGFGSRNSAPLPAFPRQSFTNSLPSSPFAAANAANNNGAGLQKRMSMPSKPGIPPPAIRSAMARNNRYTMSTPLVSSPLSDRRKTMSHVAAPSISSQSSDFTPSGSDNGSEKAKSDAISIISTSGRSRTYFTHGGRVTVEAGELPPSLQKKDMVAVAVTETPITVSPTQAAEQKKKRRFSMFGKKTTAIAAH